MSGEEGGHADANMPALLASKKSFVLRSSAAMLRRLLQHARQTVFLLALLGALTLLALYSLAAPQTPDELGTRLWYQQLDPESRAQIQQGRIVVPDNSGEEIVPVDARDAFPPREPLHISGEGEAQGGDGGGEVVPVDARDAFPPKEPLQIPGEGEAQVVPPAGDAGGGEVVPGMPDDLQGKQVTEATRTVTEEPRGVVEDDTYENTAEAQAVINRELSPEFNEDFEEDAKHRAITPPEPFREPGPTPNYTNLMNVDPPPYLENYATPCWMEQLTTPTPYNYDIHYNHPNFSPVFKEMEGHFRRRLERGASWRVRCLPAFYIAGFTKCGTSELFQKLTFHPLITEAPFKEPHYWSRLRTGWLNKKGFAPISNFVNMYDKAAEEIRRNAVRNETTGQHFHPIIFGEGSVTTFFENDFWRNLPENAGLSEPRYHLSQYLLHIQPQAKILITLRNPTDRLYSDYIFFGKEGKSAEKFDEAMVDAVRQFRACLEHRTLWGCITDRDLMQDPLWKNQLHLRTGLYSVHVERWLEFLPRSQFYVSRLENFAKHRIEALNDVCRFLGVGPLPEEAVRRLETAPQWNNQIQKKASIGPMLNQTRQLLDDFYRPYNEKLAALLNDPGYLWHAS